MKKLITVILSSIMLISSVPFSAAASDNELRSVMIISDKLADPMISWKNPNVDGISGMDVTDGEGNSLGLAVDMGNGAINNVAVSGLTAGETYKFIISYKVDNKPYAHEIDYTHKSVDRQWTTDDGYSLGKWNYEGKENTVGRFIDQEEKYEGGSSLKLVSNLKSGFIHTPCVPLAIDRNEQYICKFYAKVENARGTNIWYCNDWGARGYISSTEWTEYSLNISNAGALILRFGIEVPLDALWIDDVRLYRVSDGEEIEVPQGCFETEVYDVQFDGNEVTWQEPDNIDYEGANVYIKTFEGEWEKLTGELILKGTSSFEIPSDKIPDESFKIKVCGYFAGSREYRGYSIDVLGDVDIYSLKVTNADGEKISTLEPGVVEVSRKVTNNKISDGFPVALISALYCDDELVAMSVDKASVSPGETKLLTVNTEIPEMVDDKYELQIFFWNSTYEQNYIREMTSFK